MIVDVLLFAAVHEAVGTDHLRLELDAGATAGDVVRVVRGRAPALGALPLAVAVNEALVDPAHVLGDGDTVAVLPPMSGG